jgi:hypothetical protein
MREATLLLMGTQSEEVSHPKVVTDRIALTFNTLHQRLETTPIMVFIKVHQWLECPGVFIISLCRTFQHTTPIRSVVFIRSPTLEPALNYHWV